MSTASLFLFLYRQFTPVTQTDWPTCAAATREDNQPITRQRPKTEDDLLQFKPSSTRAGPSVSEAADVLREERGAVLLRARERRSRLSLLKTTDKT